MSVNKILVVGAGIAGPTVCYWLKRYGFSPTLVEKAPSIRTGGQAIDVRGVAIDLVKAMGIHEAICNERTTIKYGRNVDHFGNLLHEEVGEKVGLRQDNEVEIVRGSLVAILMKAIAGTPCYFNQSIQSIDQDEAGVTVTFKDGNCEQYDLVVGADGIYSATRRLAFAKDAYQHISLGAYLSTFTIPNYLDLSHTEIVCEINEKMAYINSDKDPNLALAGFMFRSKHILADARNEQAQKAFLHSTFSDFGWEANTILEYMDTSTDFYFDIISQIKMPTYTNGRVVLVGDAGYCASPLSGQGNNLAMVGAYILAGELKMANGNYQQALQRYNELMRPFVEMNQQFGAWVSESYFSKDELSTTKAEERTNKVLEMIKKVSNGIVLPNY